MNIIFIRHAESENNLFLHLNKIEYEKVRSFDPKITNLGINQI